MTETGSLGSNMSTEDMDLLAFICQDLPPLEDLQEGDGGGGGGDLLLLTNSEVEEMVRTLDQPSDAATAEADLWDQVINEGIQAPLTGSPDVFDDSLFSPAGYAEADTSSKSASSPGSSSGSSSEQGEHPTQCHICGRGVDGKHSYYGAKAACISCRGFFRRSVQNNHYPLFRCDQKKRPCEINSTNRMSCKSCRFRKCLEAGMKVSWVMSEQERRGRGKKRSQASPSSRAIVRNTSLGDTLTRREQDQLQDTYLSFMDSMFKRFFATYSHNVPSFRRIIMVSLDVRPMERDLLEEIEDFDLKTMVDYGFELQEMKELLPYDRMTLLQRNHKLCFSLLYVAFTAMNDLSRHIQEFMEYGEKHRREDPSIDGLMEEVVRLEAECKALPKVQTYMETVWELMLGDAEGEEAEDARRLVRQLVPLLKKGPDGEIDHILVIILLKLLFFKPLWSPGNRQVLEDAGRVQKAHDAQAWQLHRYLRTRYGESANARFHKCIMITHAVEKISQIVAC